MAFGYAPGEEVPAEVLAQAVPPRSGISSETMAAVLEANPELAAEPEVYPPLAAEPEVYPPLDEPAPWDTPHEAAVALQEAAAEAHVIMVETEAALSAPEPAFVPAPVAVSVPVEITTGPLKRISNSEVGCFMRCRRKWWLQYVRRLRFNRPDVVGARSIGTRLHAGVADGYVLGAVGFDVTRAYARIAEDYAADQLKVAEYFDAHPELPEAQRDTLLTELGKDIELVQIMTEGYAQWLEETAADANLEVIAIEEEIEVPLMEYMGVVVHLMGKLDKRFRRLDSGFMAFLDFKSVPNLKDLPKTANMNPQGKTYSVLLKLAHPEEHIDGEVIRMLRKVKRTKTAKPPFYGDHEVRWNAAQLNNFVARLYGVCADIVANEIALAAGADPQVVAYAHPTSDCSWDCDFYPVCDMFDDGSRVEDALAAHYHHADPNDRYVHLNAKGSA